MTPGKGSKYREFYDLSGRITCMAMDPGRTNHIIQYEINTVAGNTERNINYKCNA